MSPEEWLAQQDASIKTSASSAETKQLSPEEWAASQPRTEQRRPFLGGEGSLLDLAKQGVQYAGETGYDIIQNMGAELGRPLVGGAQLLEKAITGSDPLTGAALKRIEQQQLEAQSRSPYASGLGQALGIAAPIAATWGTTAAPSLTRALLLGTGSGLAQPVEPGAQDYWTQKAEQGLTGAGVGGALKGVGVIGGKLSGKYAQPAEAQILARTEADKLGFKTTPEMASRWDNSVHTDLHNIDLMTRKVTQEAGEATTDVNPKWIANRYNTLSKDYTDFFTGKQFKVDTKELAPKLQGFLELESQMPATLRDSRVVKQAVGFLQNMQQQGGNVSAIKVDGPALHEMYKRLGDLASSRDASSEFKQLANSVRSAIKTSIESNLDEKALKKFEGINKKWQALKAIDDSGAVDKQTNRISGDRLGAWISKQERPDSYGSDGLRQLGTIGQKLGIGSESQRVRSSLGTDPFTKAGRARSVVGALTPSFAKERLFQQYATGAKPDLTSAGGIAMLSALLGRRELQGGQ